MGALGEGAMRRSTLLGFAAGVALVAATATDAGPLIFATWTQTLQGVDITVTNSAASCTSTGANLVQQMVNCPPGGLFAWGSSTGSSYAVSLTLPGFSLTQSTTGGSINIHTAAVVAGGTQTIVGNASAAAANTGIPGMVTVKVAAHAFKGANASLLTAGPTTLVKVPLSIGKAGTFTGYFYVITNIHYITVDFYAWTPNTVVFTGLTTKDAPLPDVLAMGSYGLVQVPMASTIPASQVVNVFAGGGVLTLVSPSKISIDGGIAQRRTASFTSLKLTYVGDFVSVHGTMVPEPVTLLLLAAGASGLLLARRRSS
jgi:hypothetical protein